ncbi:MAG: nuclear transport factor 2 family protein, partial [Acidobacteria bacterium]|nr:nuclear transport factor 2 family protein [Acidobacteriota bacterium]
LAAPTAQDEPAAAVVDAFVEGLNARDLERVAATLADDVTAFVPGAQAERVEGKPALLAILRAFITDAAAGGGATAIVPVDRQLVRHGDVAIVTFHVRGEAVLARRSFIVARSDGVWRIVHFHASNLRPAGP